MWPLPRTVHRQLVDAINIQVEKTATDRQVSFAVRPPERARRRIRIGYLSASFRNHPIGHVTKDLFRVHDRKRFEVHVFFAGSDKPNPYTQAIERGAEYFYHVPGKISEVAAAIYEKDLDALIYLDGYMEHRLMQMIAMRPAPVQIYWLGHAGGCEISAIDYMIADEIVVPPEEEALYRPKVVRLPGTYHCASPHDIARHPSRAAAGLPESGFVFCGFNNPEKIDRTIFNTWMRILGSVPESVLWLSAGPTATFQTNIRAEAEKCGVSAERVIFADRVAAKADHLARLRHCGLLLDTITLNASTTALDALWAGVPVLTLYGDRFASRIATSMLKAIGLDDMICHSLGEYERRAIYLATTTPALNEIRHRLCENLKTHPLFDIQRFCRNLENALETVVMQQQLQIPPATNAPGLM
jgi:predicted O-linked N-acetylglucosamine transferase (SPINDLY family)